MKLVPLNYLLLTVCFDNFIVWLFEGPQRIIIVIGRHSSDRLLPTPKWIVNNVRVKTVIVKWMILISEGGSFNPDGGSIHNLCLIDFSVDLLELCFFLSEIGHFLFDLFLENS